MKGASRVRASGNISTHTRPARSRLEQTFHQETNAVTSSRDSSLLLGSPGHRMDERFAKKRSLFLTLIAIGHIEMVALRTSPAESSGESSEACAHLDPGSGQIKIGANQDRGKSRSRPSVSRSGRMLFDVSSARLDQQGDALFVRAWPLPPCPL